MRRISPLVVFLILGAFLVPQVQAAGNFPDVATSYQYSQAIQALKERAIVQGFPNGTFGPDRLITRAELLKIALEGAGVSTADLADAESPFPDMGATHGLRQYVIYAQHHQIVSGYPDGTYRPDNTTTRGEAIKMLLNINEVIASGSDLTWHYQDVDNSDPLAAYIYTARDQKVIPNKYKTKTVAIGEKITRGEVAEMMYRLLMIREQQLQQYPEANTDLPIVSGAYPTSSFTGLTLLSTLPKTLVANTYYPISATTSAAKVRVLIQNEADKQWLWEYQASDGKVRFDLHFPEAGQYRLALISDDAKKAPAVGITVLDHWQASFSEAPQAIANPSIAVGDDNVAVLTWNGDQNKTLLRLECDQGTNRTSRLIVAAGLSWRVDYQMFEGFAEGDISCHLSQAGFDTFYTLTSQWSNPVSWSFSAITHNFRTWLKNNVTVDNLPLFTKANRLTLSGVAVTPLSNWAAVVMSDGAVKTFSLSGAETDTLNAGSAWSLTLDLSQDGVYFVEINDLQGIAVLNAPVYKVTGVPVLPDFVDMQTGLVIEKKSALTSAESAAMTRDLLQRINAIRADQGRTPVTLDPTLTAFAQAHADDMVAKDYFSHKDRSGRSPEQRKLAFDILQPVGENIAFSVTIADIDEGLKRSAVHRLNMLDARWSRVGIGLARAQDGLLYAVEEFSTRSFIVSPLTAQEKVALAERTLERINISRTAAGLGSLTLGSTYTAPLTSWQEAPQSTNLRQRLIDAGLGLGRLLTSEGQYSANLPAELALQSAVSEPSMTKMEMAVTFQGEQMFVAVLLY